MITPRTAAVLLFFFSAATLDSAAQPTAVAGGVRFSFHGLAEKSVVLAGDFNAWSKDETPLRQDSSGEWSATVRLLPGSFQYKFFVDGSRYEIDSANPATIDNFDHSSRNSIFLLTPEYTVVMTAEPPEPRANPGDDYPPAPDRKAVYLNIIWHQHQPLYINPEKDQLSGPWVRTHGTKDYYDMAATLRSYPKVHCTINLTSSLLLQLREYYLKRLGPYVDVRRNTIDDGAFLAAWRGKTDPWIDLALKPAEQFTHEDQDFLYRNAWNAFGISQVMIARFPQYLALRRKLPQQGTPPYDCFSPQEMREIKFWFYLAYFDPDFFRGPVRLPDGATCDLSGYVDCRDDSTFVLKKTVTEADCHRMVVECYKVLAGIIPEHKALRYSEQTPLGQVEVITTPYCHPILPLLYDTDLARTCQPNDSLPPRFSFPEDAAAQVAKGVNMYREIFGSAPSGMWPGEGAVAQPILSLLRDNGILWTASDVRVLARSKPLGMPNTTPYRFPAGDHRSISLVFRDTELSDRIGFKYQGYKGEEAAEDFITTILSRAPARTDNDVLITVILDGENAWEWYRKDIDGKEFLHALYRKLSRLYDTGRIITTTTSEYIKGNAKRGIAPHSANRLPAMRWLWPGSWINANFDTWIGEFEENTAWAYLLTARTDLGRSRIKRPAPAAAVPAEGTKAWYGYKAWEEMYAAEGSDWFWWYGNDQTAPGGDKPFDIAYITHLRNVYKFANRAGAALALPAFKEIIAEAQPGAQSQGTMAQSRQEMQTVLFTCDASAVKVSRAIFIAGGVPQLGAWVPNAIQMYDDGTHGDSKAGDGVWSLQVELPAGAVIEYKYTNSGERGVWSPGEEFAGRNRTVTVPQAPGSPLQIRDIFGK